MTKKLGFGERQYEVVRGWEKLPSRWSHADVAGAVTDVEDNVYVYSRGRQPVLVYDRNGRLIDSWGEHRLSNRAHGITMTADDTVLLVNDGAHSVGTYRLDGRQVSDIGPIGLPSDTGYHSDDLGSVVRGGPPFNRPTNAAVAPTGDVYVSDGYGNARVHRFDREGNLVQSWGEPGSAPGEFRTPHGIWVHNDGRVFVADRENDRIQIFSPSGEYLDEWIDVQRPQDIYMHDDGLIYIAELGWYKGMYSWRRGPISDDEHGRISIFDQEGNLVSRWSDVPGIEPDYLVAPHGICVDSEGSIYLGEVTWTFAGCRNVVGRNAHTFLKFARVS